MTNYDFSQDYKVGSMYENQSMLIHYINKGQNPHDHHNRHRKSV